jgi:hypothetical protein
VCDLETSRIGDPYIYIYDISSLRVKENEKREIYLLKRIWSTWINGYVSSIWKCVSNKNYIYSALGTSEPQA